MARLYQVSTLSEFEALPDYHSNLSSRRSTLVSTMLRDSIRFFIININYFSLKKLIQVEIERRDNPLMESLHARGMELANNLSLMTQKPRNGDLRELKYQTFPTEACPQASLQKLAPLLLTQEIGQYYFILDPCLLGISRRNNIKGWAGQVVLKWETLHILEEELQ